MSGLLSITEPLMWIVLALIASVLNGLFALWQYRHNLRAALPAQPPDYVGLLLEFSIVVLIIIMAFFCRATVGKLLHTPVFFTSILVAVAGVECGRTLNRYLEMRGVARRINLGKAIDKALGNTPAKDIVESTDEE